MALVFFGDAEAPVRCASELSRFLRRQSAIICTWGSKIVAYFQKLISEKGEKDVLY
jgi:hypothetical protein